MTLDDLIEKGTIEEVKKWLKKETIYFYRNKAFVSACYYGRLEVVKLLLENGADIHHREDEAFKWAQWNKNLELVDYLNNRLLLNKINQLS
jgi:ankyrin repeat protein